MFNNLLPSNGYISNQLNSIGESYLPDWSNIIRPKIDYDYDGYITKYGVPDQSKGQHLTDEFKLPNHITFSTESQYSTPERQGGEWKKEGNQWHFYASPFNLKQHSVEDLLSYFKQYEPDSVLHLP